MRNRKVNEYILHDSYAEIILRNSEKPAIIDVDKVEKCKLFNWFLSTTGYVVCDLPNKKRMLLHRFVIGEENISNCSVVDHISGDKKDNRISNLRVCSIKENTRNSVRLSKNNTSGYNGVSFHKKTQKWHAYIRVNYKRKNLGTYVDINDAIKVRQQAELKYFGFILGDKKAIKLRDKLNPNYQEELPMERNTKCNNCKHRYLVYSDDSMWCACDLRHQPYDEPCENFEEGFADREVELSSGQ